MRAFCAWWIAQRSSTRLAFLLQLATRVGNSILALFWMRSLERAMGGNLYGLFVNFQGIASLGGLGDLGLGGVVALRVGRSLGGKSERELLSFLAVARGVFLCLAIFVLATGSIFSPWLPDHLGFRDVGENRGSIALLFVLGAASASLMVVGSYVQSLNYGVGNLTWSILPLFVLTQVSMACHWFLARAGANLATQYAPYLVSTTVGLLLSWAFVRVSHPQVSCVFPVKLKSREWLPMVTDSFWSYLWSIGFMIYTVTDRALINKFFGGIEVTRYHFSSKLVELTFFVVVTAGIVSLPRITQWLASSDETDHQRAKEAATKLNRAQAFLGCSAAIIYLGINDAFVGWWFGTVYVTPLHWQYAFALSLAITSCGSSVMQLSTRCGDSGMRVSGATVGLTAAINLGLSLLAAKFGTIFGIILATAIAQSFFAIFIGRFTCRFLSVHFRSWLNRNWVMPVILVSIAFLVRKLVPPGIVGLLAYAGIATVLLAVVAAITRITPGFVREEVRAVRSMLRRPQNDP